MAVKEKKQAVEQEEAKTVLGTEAPGEQGPQPETPAVRHPMLGDRVLYWMKDGQGLKGFVGFVVDRLPLHDEWNLCVFPPTGGLTMHMAARKQSAVPELGKFTLRD